MEKMMSTLCRWLYVRWHPLWAVVPLTIAGLWFRAEHRALRPLWTDELAQINMLKQPLLNYIKSRPGHDFLVYLYGDSYLTWPFVQMFGDNKWGLAIPHIITTLLAFWLLYLVCRRHIQTFWGYAIVFAVFSWNQSLIIHAFEIRTYAVFPALALGLFYVTDRLFERQFRLRPLAAVATVIFFVLSIWFHPYGILMVGVCGMYFLAQHYRRPEFQTYWKRMLIYMGLICVIAMPLWMYCVFYDNGPSAYRHPFLFIPNPLEQPIGFFKGVVGNLLGREVFYVLLIPLAAALGMRHARRCLFWGFFLTLVVLPIMILFWSNLAKDYWFLQRQFVWVMPYFILLLGMSTEAVLEKFIPRRR